MSTVDRPPVVDPQVEADHEAAELYALQGKPFPADLDRRIRERADEARESLGRVDVIRLIHEARDEACARPSAVHDPRL